MDFNAEITPTPAYQAADGALFPTARQAAAHSASEFAEAIATEYVESHDFAQGQDTRARNVVTHFIKWYAGRQYEG